MAYRDELRAAREHLERLLAENRQLRERLRARSRLGASIAMLFWTMSALAAAFLGFIPTDDATVPTAADVTTIGDVVTPAPGAAPLDWSDVRTIAITR